MVRRSDAVTITQEQRKPTKAEVTRERILDAAAAVMAQRGFAGMTLADVADKAGTKAGSLYYHFASREALALEVLERGVGAVHAHVRTVVTAMPKTSTAADRLSAALRAHLDFVLDRSDYAKAGVRAIGQLPDELDAPVAVLRTAYGRYLAKLFRAAENEGAFPVGTNVSALRLLAIGAANWAAEWHRPDGDVTLTELGDLLVAMVFTNQTSVG
jgi:TetR/AcrR family transcriptional regulator, cholesterol catabolism regulator